MPTSKIYRIQNTSKITCTNDLIDIGNIRDETYTQTLKLGYPSWFNPAKSNKLFRGKIHVNNGKTNHLVSNSIYEVSEAVSLFMNVCDSNIEV